MQIKEIQQKASPVLRQYGIRRAAIFGSISRGDDRPDSDVDLLITLGEKPMGMFAYMEFIGEMEKNLGRKVDVVTDASANKFLKQYIYSDLKTIYEE